MIDRKKVIKALEDAYVTDGVIKMSIQDRDVLVALLKEQEPASPTWEQGKAYCGKCGQRLPRKRADREINYCGYCGRPVKWK